MTNDGSISPRSMRSQQRLHVAHHVGLPHLEGQPLLERGAERDLVEEPAVDAGNRDDAALAAGVDRLPQRARPIGGQERRRLRPVDVGVERRRRAPRGRRRRCTRPGRGRRSSTCSRSKTSRRRRSSMHLGAARRAAMRSRSGTSSIAITRSAPSRNALRIAICPTGPQPHTAIVSPRWMSQFSAAM